MSRGNRRGRSRHCEDLGSLWCSRDQVEGRRGSRANSGGRDGDGVVDRSGGRGRDRGDNVVGGDVGGDVMRLGTHGRWLHLDHPDVLLAIGPGRPSRRH